MKILKNHAFSVHNPILAQDSLPQESWNLQFYVSFA